MIDQHGFCSECHHDRGDCTCSLAAEAAREGWGQGLQLPRDPQAAAQALDELFGGGEDDDG